MTRLGLIGALVVLGLAEVSGQSQTLAAIRAAFVVNLVKFVDWPTSPLGASEPLLVCVFDDSGVLPALQRLATGQIVSRRPLAVRSLDANGDCGPCDVLYASANDGTSTTPAIRGMLASVRDRAVLTIGDTEEFLQSGGNASLFAQRDQIQIAINTSSVSRSRIRLSSKVMSLSRRVSETVNARQD